MTDIGRKPAGTGPPPNAGGGPAVGLTAGAGAVDVGAELWLAGAADVGAVEAGGATSADATAGEALVRAEPW